MPCSCLPSHRMAKASLPRPLLTGSQIVMAAAAAMAASTALPPFHSMRRPACAASGCEVETALRANTGNARGRVGIVEIEFFMGSSRFSSGVDLAFGDDLLPLRAVGVQHRGELRGVPPDGLDAQAGQALLDLGILQGLVDRGVDAADEVGGQPLGPYMPNQVTDS